MMKMNVASRAYSTVSFCWLNGIIYFKIGGLLPLLYVCSVKSHVQRTLNIKMGMLIMRRRLLKPFLVMIIQMEQLMDLTYSKTTTCARKNVRKSRNVIPMSIITQRLASTNAD